MAFAIGGCEQAAGTLVEEVGIGLARNASLVREPGSYPDRTPDTPPLSENPDETAKLNRVRNIDVAFQAGAQEVC